MNWNEGMNWNSDSTSEPVANLRAWADKIAEQSPYLEPHCLVVSLERYRLMLREQRYLRIFRFFRALMSPPRSW